jgi:flagellar protein FliT
MQLHLIEPPSYVGQAGVLQVRRLQDALDKALNAEDWDQVRRLDQTCAVLIDKVIGANQDDSRTLAIALNELKGVYASLIVQCKREVASLAH